MALSLSWRNVMMGEAGNPCSRMSEGTECCEYLGQILLASFGSVILVIIITNTIIMVYSKFPITDIGYKRKMVQRERRGFLSLESSLFVGAAAGEPAPAPPSLTSCLTPCPSPLPQVSRGLSGGDPPRETPTPTPSLAEAEGAERRKGPQGASRSRPRTRLCRPPSQGQPAPPCGFPSPFASLGSVAYNGGSDEEAEEEMETDPPSPTPSAPHYPRECHSSPSYRSSRPSPSLRSRATFALVSPQPSLDSTRAAPSLVSRPSYSLVSTHTTPSVISRPTPSLASSVPSQTLASSASASPSPSSSHSLCPSVIQQDSLPPTSEGEEEVSEQEGAGERYTPPLTIHLVPNPRLHRAFPPHEGATPAGCPPPPPPHRPHALPLSHRDPIPPTSEGEDGEDSSSLHPPYRVEEGGRLRDGAHVQRELPHSEGTLPRRLLPVTSPHSIPLRGGEEHGRVYRREPIAHRHLRPQPREQNTPFPPPPYCAPRPRPSLWPKAHHQEPGARSEQ